MRDDSRRPVSVSRQISAPAEELFAVLADPARHPVIDGSGMLREGTASAVITGVGDIFTMNMHNDEMGEYVMANHVVEYVPNRKIGWEPVLQTASRAEDQGDVDARSGHRWIYELTPVGPDVTLVTETYDSTRAPDWLRKAVRDGERWVGSMSATLEKLDKPGRSQ
jgi:hypothetical protein